MADTTPQLVLVYNADSGLFGALSDSVHKLMSPETYECRLCALTYGLVSMHGSWRDFLEGLPFPKRFLHRDEFSREYPGERHDLPALFLDRGDDLDMLVPADTLNQATDLDGLIDTVRQALDTAGA